jgi:DNA-directed RNA polymerase specialized sigma24 family protein
VPHLLQPQPTVIAEESSDNALFAASLGDRQAFALLYGRYVDRIYRYCYGRLGAREVAEDATILIFA